MSPPIWPTDPTELARILRDSEDALARNRAAADLLPEMQRIAELVLSIRNLSRHRQWIDELAQMVLLPDVIARFADPYPFVPWARRCMLNELASVYRHHRVRDRFLNEMRHVTSTTDEPAENRLDLAADFSESDLQLIETWSPQDRIHLLCMAGLWHKVPPTTWDDWLAEVPIDPPFPPADFPTNCDRQENTQALARLRNTPANTLHQQWRRGLPRLRKLAYLQELQNS